MDHVFAAVSEMASRFGNLGAIPAKEILARAAKSEHGNFTCHLNGGEGVPIVPDC